MLLVDIWECLQKNLQKYFDKTQKQNKNTSNSNQEGLQTVQLKWCNINSTWYQLGLANATSKICIYAVTIIQTCHFWIFVSLCCAFSLPHSIVSLTLSMYGRDIRCREHTPMYWESMDINWDLIAVIIFPNFIARYHYY